jgi:hypothetical protein
MKYYYKKDYINRCLDDCPKKMEYRDQIIKIGS